MTMGLPEEGYASTAQVAIYLGVSTRTLERMRSSGHGPTPYILPTGSRGRPPVRYKVEEVRQWPRAQAAGGGGIQAWVVEDGVMCGEATRLIEPRALGEAMLENEDIVAMDLMEALAMPWRSPDDLAPYVREAEALAQGMIERAQAALSKARMEASTPR